MVDAAPEVVGYRKCKDCGRLVPLAFSYQTAGRCSSCWTGKSPLLALEVMNRGSHYTLRLSPKKEMQNKLKKGEGPGTGREHHAARNSRFAAHRRLQRLFPDVYAVILDEERVKRGLHPIARYNPIEFEKVVSETLDFNDVYDALRSSGVTDGP